MTTKKYSTPAAFRRALEDQLDKIARKEQSELQTLRRQVSFDRLLARLFTGNDVPWVLKGGYAMQLRIDNARATKETFLYPAIMMVTETLTLRLGDQSRGTGLSRNPLEEISRFNGDKPVMFR